MNYKTFEYYELCPPVYRFAVKEGLDDSFLPTQSSEKATGWDVRAAETIILQPTITTLIPLGIRCIAPQGWWLDLACRSSTFAKKQIHTLYGKIDEDYFGQIMLAAQWLPSYHEVGNDIKDYLSQQMVIEKGERVGQLIPVKRMTMKIEQISNQELEEYKESYETLRNAAGFGASGTK